MICKPTPGGQQRATIMLDSAIGADLGAMLNQTLANAAWGRVESRPSETTWRLVSSAPALTAPKEGLKIFAQFTTMLIPLAGLGVDAVKVAKKHRRAMLQSFAEPGQPGARFGTDEQALTAAL